MLIKAQRHYKTRPTHPPKGVAYIWKNEFYQKLSLMGRGVQGKKK